MIDTGPHMHEPRRILALYPGMREIACAVSEGTDLIYFTVHTFKGNASPSRVLSETRQVIARLAKAYTISAFATEKIVATTSKRSDRLTRILEKVADDATDLGLDVRTYTPVTVRQAITGRSGATKREVAARLVSWYPYLDRQFRAYVRTREQYWENAFSAIALALTAHDDLCKEAVTSKRIDNAA